MGSDDTTKQFEAAYPEYEFAPLVEIAINLATWLKKIPRRKVRRRGNEGADDPTQQDSMATN